MSGVEQPVSTVRSVKQRLGVGLGIVAAAAVLGGCAEMPRKTRSSRPVRTPRRSRTCSAGVHHRRHRRAHRLRSPSSTWSSASATAVRRCRSRSHGNPALEIALTILPAIILIAVGIPTVSTVFSLAKTSDTQCVVNVTGQQWWWEYEYPVQKCGGVDIAEPIVTSRRAGDPDQGQRAAAHHQQRRHPLVLDPEAQRQARRRAGSRPPAAHGGRSAGHLRRSVHRVLRPQPCPNAHGRGRPVRRRLRDVGGQPAGAGSETDRRVGLER